MFVTASKHRYQWPIPLVRRGGGRFGVGRTPFRPERFVLAPEGRGRRALARQLLGLLGAELAERGQLVVRGGRAVRCGHVRILLHFAGGLVREFWSLLGYGQGRSQRARVS